MGWIPELFKANDIEHEFKEDASPDIWTKVLFIACFGLVTAKHNSSISTVCLDLDQRIEATEIMEEIQAVADKRGIPFAPDIIERTFTMGGTFPPNTPTSLQLDLNRGKGSSELELFVGVIERYGAILGVDYTHTFRIHAALRQYKNPGSFITSNQLK